jgi:hypothetical protein
MQKHDRLFVRKIRNVQRNAERLASLKNLVPVPEIYNCVGERLDIEYIHGDDMRTWLISNHPKSLLNFLIHTFEQLESQPLGDHDWRDAYQSFLQQFDPWPFDFSSQDLLDQLPTVLPKTNYLGDCTLENIIASDRGFYFIDCQTSMWHSAVFDMAKLRQDLESQWFLRHRPAMIENKLAYIQRGIQERWPCASDNGLFALMLMRVLRYTKPDQPEREFLLKEIHRLCK